MINRLKSLIRSNSILFSNLCYILMNNLVRGRSGNEFKRSAVFLRRFRLVFHGNNNEVIIGSKSNLSALTNCRITIYGSHNKVVIESGVTAKDLSIYMADDGCLVHIKEKTQISGKTELAVMEGTRIVVGKEGLFSANITLRAGDSHSVVDSGTGKRINQSKDIFIGDHVWIGNSVIITKGTIIGANSIIATGSVVAGKIFPDNTAIGGNPAKVIKEGVNWLSAKIR